MSLTLSSFPTYLGHRHFRRTRAKISKIANCGQLLDLARIHLLLVILSQNDKFTIKCISLKYLIKCSKHTFILMLSSKVIGETGNSVKLWLPKSSTIDLTTFFSS